MCAHSSALWVAGRRLFPVRRVAMPLSLSERLHGRALHPAIEDGPEPPMSKQARTLAIICVGSAVATGLLSFADGNAVLYVAAAAVFIAMMVLVLRLSIRDGQRARKSRTRGGESGLGSSA